MGRNVLNARVVVKTYDSHVWAPSPKPQHFVTYPAIEFSPTRTFFETSTAGGAVTLRRDNQSGLRLRQWLLGNQRFTKLVGRSCICEDNT
jgi:hypothetical protein